MKHLLLRRLTVTLQQPEVSALLWVFRCAAWHAFSLLMFGLKCDWPQLKLVTVTLCW